MTATILQMSIWGVTARRRPSTPKQYRDAFIERVKSARIMSTKSKQAIADELKVPLDTYRTWEKRTLLPHHMIIPFCEATGTDPWMILTGHPFELGRYIASPRLKNTA